MRTLAIDCATEACSVALFHGRDLIAGHHDTIGRGHAERLVPLIAGLPERGCANRILVSLGPGSFTGVRIGLAAARALGLAWSAQVFGYPTLALVAAMARIQRPGPVSVCMTGGHGEWFVQSFGADGTPENGMISLRPENAAQVAVHDTVAGSQAAALVERRGGGEALAILPDARHAMSLPDPLLTAELSPTYGRGPDAKLPQRR